MTKKVLLHPSIIFEDSGFIISVPVPTFIFPCPRKNKSGQGEKNTRAEKGNHKSICKKRVRHVVMAHPLFYN